MEPNKELYMELCSVGNEVFELACLAENGCSSEEWAEQRFKAVRKLLEAVVVSTDDCRSSSTGRAPHL